ncbi:cellulase family glycosylhydrolase [Williamsia sp. MIQD14]|uniref:cellulase family glycosylhydrolase n=1 Tax=Williamsia sp. MIQD14 TaxID=3425703 RepID=UPI003DA09BB2
MSRLELTVLVVLAAMVCAFTSVAFLAKSEVRYTSVEVAAIKQVSTTVGISDSDLFLEAQDPAKVAKSLDAMKALGVNDVRIVIPWGLTETANNQYNWSSIDNMVNAAKARGMTVLGVVTTTPAWARPSTWYGDYYAAPANISDYSDFMSVLAKRYAGQVSSYEVWNEPNSALGLSNPDPALYTQMLKAGYTAIKAADSKATVIGGVLGSVISWGGFSVNPVDFLKGMYAAGAAGYFDALSFHPYQYTTPFSQGATLGQSPLNQLDAIRALMVGNGDAAKQIWATEYGLPTGTINPSMPAAEAQQASYIKDFLDAWNQLSYAGKAYLYTTVDRQSSNTTDGEATFGLYRDDWTMKPAAQVVKDWIAAHPTTPTTPPVVTPPANPVDALAAALGAALAQWLQALAAAFAAAFAPPTATVAAAPATTVATASAKTVTIASTTPDATTTTSTSTTSSTTPSSATQSSTAPSSTTQSSTTPSGTTPSSTTTAVAPTTATTSAQRQASSPTTTATTTSAPPSTTTSTGTPTTTTTTSAPSTTSSTSAPSTAATSTSGKVATTTPVS